MQSFNTLIESLTKNTNINLLIKGGNKTIQGMARFTATNSAGREYIKIFFTDKTSLILALVDEAIFYSDRHLGKLEGVKDHEIGEKDTLEYEGETYTLNDKDDYQFCLHVYRGEPHKDIEGECKFSNYATEDEKKELSLGTLSYTGERADVYCEEINISDITLSN